MTMYWNRRFGETLSVVAVEPAMQFISSFATHLEKLSPHLVADARPTRVSLFRIHRDTRFASDNFVASVALTEEQVCGPTLMTEFTAARRTMKPLVEFTTKALGLKF